MQKVEQFLSKFWIPVILVLSLPAIWALLVPGFYGASDDLHIAWLYQFHKTLLMGQIPPRYVPDLSFGFGYPLFNFVFPLPFYFGEVFHLLGLSFVDSIKAVFLISIPLSAFFMYLLIGQFARRSLSLVGAILYVYTPYRATDIYIRGAIGEIVSFVFLPLIILSVAKIYQKGSLRWVGIGALAFASLILSHNITAYMFFPFVGLLIIMQFFSNTGRSEYLLKIFSMVLLGFSISIYFWLPALTESSLMKYDTVFNFADHFPEISQLVKPYWGYGASVPGPGDGMSFFLGGASILTLITAFILLIVRWKVMDKKKKVFIIWSLSTVITALFLMNHRSIFIWVNLPLLPYFQFPWRFLVLTTFFTPLLIVVFEELRISCYLLIVILAAIILPVLSYFRPQDFLGRKDEYYFNRYVPYPSASEEYKTIKEEYLRLPKEALIRPNKNYPKATSANLGIKEIININDLNSILKTEFDKETVVNYNKYLFPGWVVKIDNKITNIAPGIPFGQISFVVPAGSHIVDIRFEETGFKKALDAISLVSFLVSLGLVKNLWSRSKKVGHC